MEKKTISRYCELMEQHASCEDNNCFFAFTDEQFDNAYNAMVKRGAIREGDKVVHSGAGLFGTPDGLRSFFAFYKEREEKVRQECDPQEVYDYEFRNHECMYSHDDSDVIEIIISIWGKDVARKVNRHCAWSKI